MEIVSSTDSKSTIDSLRGKFASYGIPDKIVSDNSTAFTSSEFSVFTKANGIRHIFSAPYKPSTNGEAEKAVQTFKRYLKKSNGKENLKLKLCQFLMQYRITPHVTTGLAPAELFLKRNIKTRLDLLKPDKASEMNKRFQAQQVEDSKKLRILRCCQLV